MIVLSRVDQWELGAALARRHGVQARRGGLEARQLRNPKKSSPEIPPLDGVGQRHLSRPGYDVFMRLRNL